MKRQSRDGGDGIDYANGSSSRGSRGPTKLDLDGSEVMKKLKRDKDEGIKAAVEYVSKVSPHQAIKWVMNEDMAAFAKVLTVRSISQDIKREGFKLISALAKAVQHKGSERTGPQTRLGEAGFCEALVSLYDELPDAVEQYKLWCAAIDALCFDHRQNRDRFGNGTDAPKKLVLGMSYYCGDRPFQVQAIKAMGTLSADIRGRTTSGKDDEDEEQDSNSDGDDDYDSNLPAEHEVNLRTLRDVGALKSLMTAMKTWPRDREVQEFGCYCMCNLAVYQNNRSPLGELGAIDVVLDALKNFKEKSEIQKWGVSALANLVHEQPVNLNRLIDLPDRSSILPGSTLWLAKLRNRACLAGVAVISSIARLFDPTSEDCQSRYRNYQSAMIKKGEVTTVLSAVIGSGLAGISWRHQGDLCGTVIDLARDENVRELLNDVSNKMLVGAAKVINACPRSQPNYAHVCRNGVGAINYLAMNRLEKKEDVKSVCSAIVRAIQDHPTNHDIHDFAFRAVVDLAKSDKPESNGKAKWFAQSNLPSLLVKGMGKFLGSVDIQAWACLVISQLCYYPDIAPSCRDKFHEAGACQALHTAMSQYADDLWLQNSAAEALVNLSMEHRPSQDTLGQLCVGQLVCTLTRMLDQPQPEQASPSGNRVPSAEGVVDQITAAIENLSDNHQHNQVRLREARAFSPLALALTRYPSNSVIQEQVLAGMRNLLESSPDAANEALEAGVKDACRTIKKNVKEAYSLAQDICKRLDTAEVGDGHGGSTGGSPDSASSNGRQAAMAARDGDQSLDGGASPRSSSEVRMEVDGQQVVVPKTHAHRKRPRSPLAPISPSETLQDTEDGPGFTPPASTPTTEAPAPPLVGSPHTHDRATINFNSHHDKEREGAGSVAQSNPVTIDRRPHQSSACSDSRAESGIIKDELPPPDEAPSPKRSQSSPPTSPSPSRSSPEPEPTQGPLPIMAATTMTASTPATGSVSGMRICCRCYHARITTPTHALTCQANVSHLVCADCLPTYIRELLFCPTSFRPFADKLTIPCPGVRGAPGSSEKCPSPPWHVGSVKQLLLSVNGSQDGKEVWGLLKHHIDAAKEEGSKRRELWKERKAWAKQAQDLHTKVARYCGVIFGRDGLDLSAIHCPHCWREMKGWEDDPDRVVCCGHEGEGEEASVVVGCGTSFCPFCLDDGLDDIKVHIEERHGLTRLAGGDYDKARAAFLEKTVAHFLKGLDEPEEVKSAVLYGCADDLVWFGVSPEVVARLIETRGVRRATGRGVSV